MFLAYLLLQLVSRKYGCDSFGMVEIIFLALLFANARGTWLSSPWPADPTDEIITQGLSETLSDSFSDRLPRVLWPKVRVGCYLPAGLEMAFLLFGLLVPRCPAKSLDLSCAVTYDATVGPVSPA